jgi:DNA-binding GntR family transcriptional regulator
MCPLGRIVNSAGALAARDAEAAVEMMRAHYMELDLNFADVIFGQASEN